MVALLCVSPQEVSDIDTTVARSQTVRRPALAFGLNGTGRKALVEPRACPLDAWVLAEPPIDEGQPGSPEQVELASHANSAIHEVAVGFSAGQDEDFAPTFFCQCGCMNPVALTLAQYEASGGAWFEGHSRPDSTSS